LFFSGNRRFEKISELFLFELNSKRFDFRLSLITNRPAIELNVDFKNDVKPRLDNFVQLVPQKLMKKLQTQLDHEAHIVEERNEVSRLSDRVKTLEEHYSKALKTSEEQKRLHEEQIQKNMDIYGAIGREIEDTRTRSLLHHKKASRDFALADEQLKLTERQLKERHAILSMRLVTIFDAISKYQTQACLELSALKSQMQTFHDLTIPICPSTN